MIDAELGFETIFGPPKRRHHHAGVRQHQIEWPAGAQQIARAAAYADE
jgi:hypothetical protein